MRFNSLPPGQSHGHYQVREYNCSFLLPCGVLVCLGNHRDNWFIANLYYENPVCFTLQLA